MHAEDWSVWGGESAAVTRCEWWAGYPAWDPKELLVGKRKLQKVLGHSPN